MEVDAMIQIIAILLLATIALAIIAIFFPDTVKSLTFDVPNAFIKAFTPKNLGG